MSGGFEDRRKGQEAKWAHDEELRFKVMARRNKLLGLWAAGERGLSGNAAAAYAKEVVAADFEEAGDEDVYRKVRADLPAGVSEQTIRQKMEEFLVTAGDQIEHEAKK
ncbi:MAG TPA: DUF1476 domain-containing protein [Rhizomicrobium sp.]|jgi:hypothetical protein|nr:DUF1476 domain-containing protein [Rhizomicrobium sp.]